MPEHLFAAAALALYPGGHAHATTGWQGWAPLCACRRPSPSRSRAIWPRRLSCALRRVIAALLAVRLHQALSLPLPTPALACAAFAVAAGIALGALSNLALIGKFGFTPGGSAFPGRAADRRRQYDRPIPSKTNAPIRHCKFAYTKHMKSRIRPMTGLWGNSCLLQTRRLGRLHRGTGPPHHPRDADCDVSRSSISLTAIMATLEQLVVLKPKSASTTTSQRS